MDRAGSPKVMSVMRKDGLTGILIPTGIRMDGFFMQGQWFSSEANFSPPPSPRLGPESTEVTVPTQHPGTQMELSPSCGKTQTDPRAHTKTASGPFHFQK